MKKLFHVTLALMLCVSAGFAQEDIGKRVDGLQAQVNRALAKAGIHFGGEFRSQFLNSEVSGDAVEVGKKKSESAEFTSVDFDVVARPNAALSARAMFRLHQDWRNFFSDVQNPITTRWLSIDGLVGGMLEYHAGDYLKKLSPLTLWNHEYEVLYEPEIFAADRRLAMSEAFVGDSKKLLQGFDVSLKAELYPILKEIDIDAFGARLATRGTNESAVVPPGAYNGNYLDADFDRYLIGANLGSQIIHGFGVGVSDIYIFDYLASYMGTEDEAKTAGLPQATNVVAGRLNFDTRVFGVDDGAFLLGVNFEAALSSDKGWNAHDSTFNYQVTNEEEEIITLDSTVTTITDFAETGMALNIGGSFRVAFGEANNIKGTVDYVRNDKTFRNDAAQSPHFVQRQIMNSENALGGLGLRNPFDAMYRAVFKYVPSQYFGGTKPYTKNAYNNVILTKNDRDSLSGRSDVDFTNVFQDAGNKATANRTGPLVKLDGSFLDEAFTAGVRLTMFQAMEEVDFGLIPNEDGQQISASVMPEFLTAGGGFSVDVAKFLPALGPSVKIGLSYMMYNSTNGQVNRVSGAGSKVESESKLISGELNWNFAPRFSILAGYQQLNTLAKSETVGQPGVSEAEYTFYNIGAGLGYKVADGGALTVKLTRLSGEGPVVGEIKSYEAWQPEVSLTVKF